MSLNDVKLAVINADLGTTGQINNQEKAFWDAALAAGGVSTKTATFKPASGVGVLIDQDNNEISLDIDSEATTADVLNISATALTTGTVIEIPDVDSLTTGSIVSLLSDSASPSTRDLIRVVNDNTAATGTTLLSLRQDAAQCALLLDHNADGASLEIDSEATSSPVIDVNDAKTTIGSIVKLENASALTTGKILSLHSNSASTSGRALAKIVNDNSLAVGASLLQLQQDAANKMVILDHSSTGAGSSYVDFQATAAANAVNPISTLTTSGAPTHHIQMQINGVKAWVAASTTDPS